MSPDVPAPDVPHVDVLIVGAGLSGIGAAAQLTREVPERTYLILESRASIGGTWDLFTYPGVRSDSDMFTLGYRFRPWQGEKALADGPSILTYVRETARDYSVEDHIRYGHRVVRAEWSSHDRRWTVTAQHEGGQSRFTCSLLWSCAGYYSYESGYAPDFPGQESFTGPIVHPQAWPADLDYAGRRVVVIGSGATAVTLVPAMAATATKVTMLQRSPTYVMSLPSVDRVANIARRLLPQRAAYVVIRWKNIVMSRMLYRVSQKRPNVVRKLIRKDNVAHLPQGYDVDTHFNPTYGPWDQRLCLVPDADLFEAIASGRAEAVTDTVATFTPKGIDLASGRHLDADIIVTATGLNLEAFGGAEVLIDGAPVDLPSTMGYKALMLSGVPNFVFTVGYTNASWTLKADLVAEFVVRVLRHLRETGTRVFVPVRDPSVGEAPFMDFEAGYVLRAIDQLPKQGDRAPWRLDQDYLRDIVTIRRGKLDDGVLTFSD